MTALALTTFLPLTVACGSSSDSPSRENAHRETPDKPGGDKPLDPQPNPDPSDTSCNPFQKSTCKIYLSPEGNDSSLGTSDRPLKTLTKALTIARAGQTVSLAAGRYSEATGERWPQRVPSGVLLEGSSGAILSGSAGKAGLAYDGDGQIRNLAFESFEYAAIAKGGKLEVKDVKVTGGGGFGFIGYALGNLEGLTLESLTGPGVVGGEHAQIHLSNSTIRGKIDPPLNEAGCKNLIGVSLENSATAIVSGVTFANLGLSSVVALEDASASIDHATFTRAAVTDACNSTQILANGRASVVVEDTSVSNESTSGTGLFAGGTFSKLVFRRSTLKNATYGALAAARLELENSTFESIAKSGVYIDKDGDAKIAGTTISAKRYGIVGNSGAKLLVRNSKVSSEDEDAVLLKDGTSDLGRADDPGNNRLLGKETGLYVLSTGARNLVLASGNTWRPGVQGADTDGKYLPQLLEAPQKGENFVLTENTAIQF